MMKRLAFLAALAAGLTAGCGSVLGRGDHAVEMAVIALYGQDVIIEMPDTVREGERFSVTVLTLNGCETRTASHVDTRIRGLRIEIIPYRRRIPRISCPSRFYGDEQAASVRFLTRGIGTVTVVGLHEYGDTVRVDRNVFVR